jgi:hypothetical protein
MYVERSQPASLVAVVWHSITAMVAEGVNPEPVTEITDPSATFVDGVACTDGVVVVAPASIDIPPNAITQETATATRLSETLRIAIFYLRPVRRDWNLTPGLAVCHGRCGRRLRASDRGPLGWHPI